MKRIATLAAVVVPALLGFGLLAGCGPTTVAFDGADLDAVAKAVWQAGHNRPGGFFEASSVPLWPSPAAISKPQAEFRYSRPGFLGSMYGADTVGVAADESGQVVVRLKCEEKSVSIFNLLAINPYRRNNDRERRIIQRAAWSLMDANAATTVRGLSGWQPAGPVRLSRKGNATWLAFRGVAAAAIADYLMSQQYTPTGDSSGQRQMFRKDQAGEADEGWFVYGREGTRTTAEMVVVRPIDKAAQTGRADGLVAVGFAARATERLKDQWVCLPSLLFPLDPLKLRLPIREPTVDFSDTLSGPFLDGLTLHAAVTCDHLRFEDPAGLAEPMEIPEK